MAAAGPAEEAGEYVPRRPARLTELDGREGRIALTQWGPGHPSPIVLLHGWMDCGAGWQLLVDQLPDEWPLVAVDWPGYGRSARRTDRYWFADHLAELDWLAGVLSPDEPVRLIGHSMGGTVASIYAGVRAARVAWLANLEGFGMPELPHAQFPGQLAAWLDALKSVPTPRRYPRMRVTWRAPGHARSTGALKFSRTRASSCRRRSATRVPTWKPAGRSYGCRCCCCTGPNRITCSVRSAPMRSRGCAR
jgi:pimeloyl-ACP methyl ester carboxylesterase